MKKITLITFLSLIFNLCIGQEKPLIEFVSTTNVVGTCNFGSIVYAKYGKEQIRDSVIVKNGNNFILKFKKVQTVGDKVLIWTPNKNPKIAKEELYTVDDDATIVNKSTTRSLQKKFSYQQQIDSLNYLNAEKDALKNTTLTYKNTIWSTNFCIPLVRFNFVKGDDSKQGDILLFNSIGAGIGHYWGRLERTRDDRGEIVNEEFSNTFGFSLGALFSAKTGEDEKNVFAPVLNVAALDFQLGIGIELGTRTVSQKREFVTLSYSIPLYKLFKRSYRVRKGYHIPIESTRKTQG